MNTIEYSKITANSRIALVFDVETNGLLDMKKSASSRVLEESPYVLQLSYAMYDMYHQTLIKTVDTYIKIPEHVDVPAETTKINGITREMCDTKGVPMLDVLLAFYKDYHMTTVCVAHNYRFDSAMINIEYQRHWAVLRDTHPYALNLFQLTYMRHLNMRYKCTMMDGQYICKIPKPVREVPQIMKTPIPAPPTPTSDNIKPAPSLQIELPVLNIDLPIMTTPVKKGYKWPTLVELYTFYFKKAPTGMHNSMMDVLVTLQCYLMMENRNPIQENDFMEMVRKI